MNEENLIPFTSEQSREEAKKNGKKGGIASGRVRRDKRTFRETAELLLSLPDKDKDGNPLLSPVTGKAMSIRENLVMQALLQARKGNIKALQAILDIMGERIIKSEVTGKDGKDLFATMTEEELQQKREELLRKLS